MNALVQWQIDEYEAEKEEGAKKCENKTTENKQVNSFNCVDLCESTIYKMLGMFK